MLSPAHSGSFVCFVLYFWYISHAQILVSVSVFILAQQRTVFCSPFTFFYHFSPACCLTRLLNLLFSSPWKIFHLWLTIYLRNGCIGMVWLLYTIHQKWPVWPLSSLHLQKERVQAWSTFHLTWGCASCKPKHSLFFRTKFNPCFLLRKTEILEVHLILETHIMVWPVDIFSLNKQSSS